NYPKEAEHLNFYQKLNRLTQQAALNQNVKRNSLHISLNFDPSEKLETGKLKEVAEAYMTKIGFAEQPYLVYSHHDAGHPHIHIVTTNIQESGKRIELHNIGRDQSEKARKEIEREFKLVMADDHKLKQAYSIKPVQAVKVSYGKSETRRAIANVLGQVLGSYKYTSLPELNAVLGLYNVAASRGSEKSRIFEKGGLIYRVLDEKCEMVGVPIKASLLPGKPILSFLERKFEENQKHRLPYKQRIRNAIDWSLKKGDYCFDGIVQSLKKEKIDMVIRPNKQGLIYGITFVDHQTKSVFKGSDLGKGYSAHNILYSLNHTQNNFQTLQSHLSEHSESQKTGLLEDLISPDKESDYVPFELKLARKKRKRQYHRS
ncbi:MAG TPA: relaxase/mobilization nuclease domain-containing protein, partial [Puia sp.]|nr:relaxase/mobilization nuclease domain-containing protein [Puia sp.]